MKKIYTIFSACIVTAVITAFATAYVVSKHYTETPGDEFTCNDNASPDINGCCPGEELKDMPDVGFVCCPLDGGDCLPPIQK